MFIFLFATEGAAPNYFVACLHFDEVGSGILFGLPTPTWNVLSHFRLYKVADRIRMNPVVVVLLFYGVTVVDWSSSGGSDGFFAFDFANGTAKDYQSEKIAPVKRRKVDDGSVVLGIAPAVVVNWLPGVARKTFSEVKHD